MGKKEGSIIKVVLDTNVLVSALLFTGRLSKIADLWRDGEIIPVLSEETFRELTKVFAYPKFSLSEDEIRELLKEEILPYFEFTKTTKVIKGVCQDSDDDKFLSCALSASVDFVVSGDKGLIGIREFRKIKIITPQKLLKTIITQ